MPYEIHIERCGPDAQRVSIPLSEWRAIVGQTDGVRMAEGDLEITNPKTSEIIRLRNDGGDAEVFDNAAWQRVFRWSPSSRVSFRAPRDFENRASAIRRIAALLACRLEAQLVGDEGEIYD